MEDTVLAMGRAAAEQRMLDEVAISHAGGSGFDWSTGTETPSGVVNVYTGKARVRAVARAGREVDAGEANVTLREYVVSVPWSLSPPPDRVVPGDVVDVVSSRDARIVGLRLWVTGVEYGAGTTAWRIQAEDRS